MLFEALNLTSPRHGEAGRQGLLWPSRPLSQILKVLDHHALCEGS